MRKIGINTDVGLGFGIDTLEMLSNIKTAGFDAVFVDWAEGCPLSLWKSEADRLGLELPFVHAPFSKIEYIWEEGEIGEWVLSYLLSCLADCAANQIPIMVAHVAKGFDKEEIPTQLGIDRFTVLLDRAAELGVQVAFENTEGEIYLEAVKNALWSHSAAGFCIDTGHEMCYNYSRDMIGKYGDKLIATHINDNLGISGKSIFWHDDLHLLPWDGIGDFEGIARRIQKTGYNGILMFELTVKSKPNRHENDAYLAMGCEAYLQEAHRRAVRFANLFDII